MALRFRLVQMLAVAALLGVAGYLFGLTEASALAIGLVGVIAASWFRSLLLRADLDIERIVTPSRCYVGDGVTVELITRNNSPKPSPAVVFVDAIDGKLTASIQLGPLQPAEAARSSFSLATDRRGLLKLGPLSAATIDPFGLTTRRLECRTPDMIVAVRPKVWALPEVDLTSRSGSDQIRSSGVDHRTGDDEFSSLNEYTPGDDVRHIHWPSTARMGRPIIRRNEPMAERHSTIVIDVRPSPADPTAFERALSVVASLINVRRDEPTRVLTLGEVGGGVALRDLGTDIALGNSDRAEHLLDQLCVLDQGQEDSLDALLVDGAPTALGISSQPDGHLVVVTPRDTSESEEGGHLRLAMEGFGDVLLISTSSSPPISTPPPSTGSRSSALPSTASSSTEFPSTRQSWPTHLSVMSWDGTTSLTSTWLEYMSNRPLVDHAWSGGL